MLKEEYFKLNTLKQIVLILILMEHAQRVPLGTAKKANREGA